MNLNEMHVWFRQYAQQMGMQNVRAILPEQIDIVINTSISDTVNELIRTNIGLTNDRIITDNSKLGQINALRTLIRTKEIPYLNIIEYPLVVEYNFSEISPTVGGYKLEGFISPSLLANGNVAKDAWIDDILQLIDLSVNYYKGEYKDESYYLIEPRSGVINLDHAHGNTAWYPVRLIDNMYLADTLQDFFLGPKPRSPIAVLYGKNPDSLEIYFGKEYYTNNNTFGSTQILFNSIRVNYLGRPAKVCYRADVDGVNTDCDLPDYLHVDILKHAVDLYRVAIQGSLYANQQQQQAQNREIGRNNVRPDNEGYQN